MCSSPGTGFLRKFLLKIYTEFTCILPFGLHVHV